MKAFAVHARIDFAMGLRNRTLLLMHYLMPLGFYVVVGAIMTAINPLFGPQMIPAMIVFAILCSTLLGLPTPLIEAREANILRTYRIHGMGARPLLAIPALATGIHMTIVAALIIVTAPWLFGAPLPVRWLPFALVFGLALACHIGLGLLIGVIAANSRVAVLWQQVLYLPSMLLGGLMVPLDMLPGTLGRVARLLPASYAMEGFQNLAYGDAKLVASGGSLLVLFSGACLAFLLAGYLFRWTSEGERRRSPAWAALALVPYVVGALVLG